MAQLKDTVITGDARVTGTLYAQEGTTTVPGLLSTADKTNLNNVVATSHSHSNKANLDAITATKMTNWDTAYSNSHTHSNKSALDAITSTKMTNWDNAATNSHTHSNKSALDAITSTKMTNWDTAYSNSHTHSNKSALDAITSTKMTKWDNAATNSHSHTNKSVLDGITSAKVSSWDGKQSALTEGTDYLNKTHLDNTYVAKTSVGANSGIAELDATGKVPSSQLPSFVDDVLEYSSQSAFPTTGEAGKIYIAQDTNKTYRWSGSAYVEISASLALGETSSTAYRGDRGKTAYDHSQDGDVHVTTTQKTNWNTAYSNSHTHSNKTVLDGITSTKVSNWDGAATNSHTHSNKTALDAITSTKMTNWDTAYTNSHTHSNKANLDAITATKMTNWDTAYTNSHSHSNKAVLDTVTSAVVSNSHTHSNKTALDAITSTKMTNWDTAYSNSHSHTNKSVLDGISSTDVSNWNSKVPSTRTVNGKALSSDINLMLYDLAPTMTKTYTNVIGTANNWAGATFFWGSVKPTSWTALWEIKFYIKTYVPGKAGYEQESYVIVSGSYGSLRSYVCWNNVNAYNVTYYYELYRMKEAGFNNGYGHALGSRFYSSYSPTDSNYKRTIEIEIYETKNCTFTFFDSCLPYASIPGTGSTNYDTYSEMYAAGNGMQETGDSNDVNYQNRVYYTSRKAAAALYRYQICFTTLDNKILPANSISNSVATDKTLTTESFDPFGGIYYYNTTTTIAVDGNVGNATLYRQILADMRYGFNVGAGSYFTARLPVYVKATPQSDGSAKLDATTPLVQALPNSEDGSIYIYLGQAYEDTNPYRIELMLEHPVYYYKNGAIRLWTNSQPLAEIAYSGNLADGFDDDSHRLVTDLQISTWNAKSNFSGAYSDLTGKPTIPTTLAQLSGDSTHRVVTDTQINTWTDAYTLPSGGIPFNDLSQTVQDLLTNTSALFDTEVIISDVYLKRYAAGRLMISKVE